jgi:signal transduction histidine kinase/ActR/RegA family two-component response regulator
MIALKRWSIRRRIILVGVVPVLLAVLSLTSYHMAGRWEDILQANDNVSSIVLQHLVISAEYPVMSGNIALLEPLVDAALLQPAIVAVIVYDDSGDILLSQRVDQYDDVPEQDIQTFQQPVMQTLTELDAFSEFEVATLPSGSRKQLATIALQVTNTFSQRQQAITLRQSLAAGGGVLLLTVLIGVAISTTIIPALEKLTRFIDALAQGKLDTRLDVDDGAEIGLLQKNTNSLANSLLTAREDTQEYTRRLKEEQARTEAASQAKSRFLTMVSHELRTPLNGVSGALEVIQLDQSSSEFELYKSIAKSSLDQLTMILQDVLVIVDAEKGKLPVSIQQQRLPQILSQVVLDYRKEALERRLSFVAEYDDTLKRQKVSVDPALVRQIARHLLSNAMKFTADGYVVFTASHQLIGGQPNLVMTVSDTGIGIPADKKELIFEAFAQVSEDFNRRYDGMGLGLTLVNQIVNILGGKVYLDSSLNTGTVARVELPVSVAAVESRPVKRQSGAAARVLIVEDNRVNLMILKKMINKQFPTFQVDSVESGEECLEQVVRKPYELILMDCQMPGMDGFETTQKLREQEYSMPIVACTANASSDVQERCLAVGMDGFIGKPVHPDTLKSELKAWLVVPEGQASEA